VRRLFNRGSTQTALVPAGTSASVVTAIWPVPKLVVVGGGLIASALLAAAGLLGWTAVVVETLDDTTRALSGLTHADAVVVLSHDRELDGAAMLAALSSGAGYVGGLGSARTQAARADWLAAHGVTGDAIASIYGPAGLDIAAFAPGEIAIAITAEVVAVRSGASGGSLRGRTGPVRPG
jgi:xanthine dehydrogenase accessory factor